MTALSHRRGRLDSLWNADAGFEADTNEVIIIGEEGAEWLPLQSKTRVAGEILNRIEKILTERPAKAGH